MLKKLGKKRILIFLCLILVLAGGFCFYRTQKTETGSTEEVKLEKGQSFVYGEIVSIYGNEITYHVTEEAEEKQEEQKESTGKSGRSKTSKEGFSGERPQMPEGGFSGERPTMPEGGFSGERPSMLEGSFGGERPSMPEGGFSGESSQMPWEKQGNNTLKEKEVVTVQIPVGTKVTTRLGTVTTFSRLAAEDNIKMLVQEEEQQQVILEIWIVD